MTMPRFHRGFVGSPRLTFGVLNSVMDATETVQALKAGRNLTGHPGGESEPAVKMMVAKVYDGRPIDVIGGDGTSLIRETRWERVRYKSNDPEDETFFEGFEEIPVDEHHLTSTLTTEGQSDAFGLGAVVVHPPFAFVFITRDSNGGEQRAYMFRAPSKHQGRIKEVIDGPTPTYIAETDDHAIVTPPLPAHRLILGATYQPAPVGSSCTIGIHDDGTYKLTDVEETIIGEECQKKLVEL